MRTCLTTLRDVAPTLAAFAMAILFTGGVLALFVGLPRIDP